MVLKIAYSEGHGKHTPGKRTPDGEREWYFNHLVGTGFAEELAKYDGVVTKLVSDPTGERDVPLQERSDISNDWDADIYASFHHNAYQGRWGTHTGTETFTYNGDWGGKRANDPQEIALAKDANDAIVSVYQLRNRGIKKENFHEVRVPKAKAFLTEGGYMDSSIDIKVMRNAEKVKESGRAIARKIASRYGLKKRQVAGAVVSKDNFFRVQVGAFSTLANAAKFAQEVKNKTKLDTYIVESGKYIRVQVGAFSVKSNAENRLKELKKHYKDAFITQNGTNAIPEAEPYNEPPRPVTKSIDAIANEIIAGKGNWGNGQTRKDRLANAGYNAAAVQSKIDEILKPKAKKEYVQLAAHESSWRVYPLNKQPVVNNESGFLNPKLFGGIEYEVLGYLDNGNTAIIQTRDFGKVKIFIKDPSAKIVTR